jgi:phi13 family phage major tail protein
MAITTRPAIGIEGLVVALLNISTDVVGGTPTWQTPVPLAPLAKLTLKPNGTVATDFADDGAAFSATTTGKIQVDLELQDVIPSSLALVTGSSYANGILQDNSVDTAPYVALGYKQWMAGEDANGNKVYRYVWLLKGVLAKPDEGGETKKDTLKYEHLTLKGEFTKMWATTAYRTLARTDDLNVSSANLTNWFNQPVFSNTADLSAFTLAVTTGAGATKTLLFTFSKASNSGTIPFTLPAATLAALVAQCQVLLLSSGAAQACTYAVLSAGTGFSNSAITVTCTTPVAATAVVVVVPSGTQIVDGSGVALSAYNSGSVTTHA